MKTKTGYVGKRGVAKLFPNNNYNRTKYDILTLMVNNYRTKRIWTNGDVAERIGRSPQATCMCLRELSRTDREHIYLHREEVEMKRFTRKMRQYAYSITNDGRELQRKYKKRDEIQRALGCPYLDSDLHLTKNLPNPVYRSGDMILTIAGRNGGKSVRLQGRARDELLEKFRLEYFVAHPDMERLVREHMKDIIAKLPNWPRLEAGEGAGES